MFIESIVERSLAVSRIRTQTPHARNAFTGNWQPPFSSKNVATESNVRSNFLCGFISLLFRRYFVSFKFMIRPMRGGIFKLNCLHKLSIFMFNANKMNAKHRPFPQPLFEFNFYAIVPNDEKKTHTKCFTPSLAGV